MEIKKARLIAGKTQAEVAKAINITQNTYSNYENNKTQPSLETLIKLADYFHVTIDSLLEHEMPYLLDKSILSKPCQKVIDKIIKLSEYQCELINTYIDGLLVAEEDKQKTISKFKGE